MTYRLDFAQSKELLVYFSGIGDPVLTCCSLVLGAFLLTNLLMWSALEDEDMPLDWPSELGLELETEEAAAAFAGLDVFLDGELLASPFGFLPNQFCIVWPQKDLKNHSFWMMVSLALLLLIWDDLQIRAGETRTLPGALLSWFIWWNVFTFLLLWLPFQNFSLSV